MHVAVCRACLRGAPIKFSNNRGRELQVEASTLSLLDLNLVS